MSENEHIEELPEGELTTTPAETAAVEPVAEPVAEAPAEVAAPIEDEDEVDSFFAESEVAAVPEVDPAKVVTILPSSGQSKYVEIEQPTAIVEIIARSGLQFNGTFTCFLNNAEIPLTQPVSGGSTVTVVGTVKGGARE